MINDEIRDAVISRSLELNRYDASLRKEVIDILYEMESEILSKLKGNISNWNKTKLNEQLKTIRDVIDGYYGDLNDLLEGSFEELAKAQAKNTEDEFDSLLGIMLNMPSEQKLLFISTTALIQGATLDTWIKKLKGDAYFRISSEIRKGYGQSTDVQQAVSTQMNVIRRNADSFTKTGVHTVASETDTAVYEQNDGLIKGKIYTAILDNRTSIQCMAYDGSIYDLQNKPLGKTTLPYVDLPAHFNCRSVYVPVIKSWKELGKDYPEIKASARPSMDGNVPRETTFSDFLDKKGVAYQNEMLGKGRAQMWRDGKITLQQLLDQSGKPIPLKNL